MSLRGTDVAAMMTRVEATLAAAEGSPEGARGVLPVAPEGDAEVNVAVDRRNADIRVEFPPGSGRPVVGPAVRLAKRAMRRAVGWYVTPMMQQQSALNHAVLDSIERLRLRIERLQPGSGGASGLGLFPIAAGGRAVAVGPSAGAVVDLLAGGPPPSDAIRVLEGDAVEQARRIDHGSLCLLVVDVTGMGPDALVDLLRAASDALAPGARVVLSSTGAGASGTGNSLHPRALVWALAALGFADPHAHALEGIVADTGDLAAGLAQVDRAVRAGAEVVVARRPR